MFQKTPDCCREEMSHKERKLCSLGWGMGGCLLSLSSSQQQGSRVTAGDQDRGLGEMEGHACDACVLLRLTQSSGELRTAPCWITPCAGVETQMLCSSLYQKPHFFDRTYPHQIWRNVSSTNVEEAEDLRPVEDAEDVQPTCLCCWGSTSLLAEELQGFLRRGGTLGHCPLWHPSPGRALYTRNSLGRGKERLGKRFVSQAPLGNCRSKIKI